MKNMFAMTSMILAGGVMLAAETPAKPVNAVATAPVAVPPIVQPMAAVTNNLSTSDAHAMEMELRQIYGKLHTYQTNFATVDSELKSLLDKRNELMKQEKDVSDQLMAKMDAKLKADPETAPVMARMEELRGKLMELRKTMGGPGMMPGGQPGMGGGQPGMMQGGQSGRPMSAGRPSERPSVFLPTPPSAHPGLPHSLPPTPPAPAPAPDAAAPAAK